MIRTSGCLRSAYIDDVTVTKLVLEGTGQISPFEPTHLQGGVVIHTKKCVWSAGADPGGLRRDGACIHHRFDKGCTINPLKASKDGIEELRKEREGSGFVA